MPHRMTAIEASQPWVTWTYGLTTDRFFPPWRSTRILGRARIECRCLLCGTVEVVTLRMPRLGRVPLPASGRHVEREDFLARHTACGVPLLRDADDA